MSIYNEIREERIRAHAKHGDTSMESEPVDSLIRLTILLEEVGEVAKEFNEARHRKGPVDLLQLRKELIQVGAMAAAWASVMGSVADYKCELAIERPGEETLHHIEFVSVVDGVGIPQASAEVRAIKAAQVLYGGEVRCIRSELVSPW